MALVEMEEHEVKLAEVISLRPDLDDDAPLRTRPKEPWCSHGKFEMDTQAERIYCGRCKREVPVFEAMLGFVREFEHYVEMTKEAVRQREIAAERLAEVERKVKNAKSRLRREVVKREADLPNDWWRTFDACVQRFHDRTDWGMETVERLALIEAEREHPGGRDA